MEKKNSHDHHQQQQSHSKKSAVWDCDSSLYDSFELKSFKQQLDSAISSRTLSMPRLSEPVVPVEPSVPQRDRKKPSRIAKSVHKLLRSVFRMKPAASSPTSAAEYMGHCYYGANPWGRGLATIPEACEKGYDSPELSSAVRKTGSERFTGRVGIFR